MGRVPPRPKQSLVYVRTLADPSVANHSLYSREITSEAKEISNMSWEAAN